MAIVLWKCGEGGQVKPGISPNENGIKRDQSQKVSSPIPKRRSIALITGIDCSVESPWSLIAYWGPFFDPGAFGFRRMISEPLPLLLLKDITPYGFSFLSKSLFLRGFLGMAPQGLTHLCNDPWGNKWFPWFNRSICRCFNFLLPRFFALKKFFPYLRRCWMVKVI